MESRATTRLPTRTRLPTASTSLAAPASSKSATTTKRTAATAGLDGSGDIEHALTRRKAKVEAFSASMSKTSLERRAADAEQAKRQVEVELNKAKMEKEKVERDRRWFAEREKKIIEERDKEREEFDKERSEFHVEMRELRTSYDQLQRQFDTLSESYDVMERAAKKANRICEEAQAQLSAVQGENEHNHSEAAKYRQLLQDKEDELEAIKMSAHSGSMSPRKETATGGESREWDALRTQLVEQTDQMRRLEDANARMKSELLVMRERHANIEVLKEEKRVLERRVRDADAVREQLGMMEAQLDALRQERDTSIAHAQRSSDIPVAVTQELAKLRRDYADLQGHHQSQASALAERESVLKIAEQELSMARKEADDLKLRLQFADATITRSEKRAKTAQQEVEVLNSLLEKFTNQPEGETGDEEADQTQGDMTERTGMRVAALETLVEELKEANAALAQELNEMGGDAASVMHGPGRGSIAALKKALDEQARLHAKDIQNLEAAKTEAKTLKARIEELDEELFKLRGEVGAGRHIPPGVRVLEFANNPAARWFGKREEDVKKLKEENEMLRGMLGEGGAAKGTGEGYVPKVTLDVVMQEKSELETIIKEKEKRLLRLQQIFSLKAEEFKTTVTTLLGWKFRFQQNGAVQLTSVYNPDALIVFSQTKKTKKTVGAGPLEGDDVKVQMIAENAPPEVSELYRTWVAGFGCVPGFLGSLTVALYEASPEGAAKLKAS